MAKVIGFVGSPRKGGNTDTLVKGVLAGAADKGAETNIYYLNDLAIKGCQACERCKEDQACATDDDMRAAIRAVKDLGGGLIAVLDGKVLGSVPLPIAGLMSDQPVEIVRDQMDALLNNVKELGSPLHDPLMILGFLALEVIPKLKLTDQGLVDVEKFDFVPLWAE